MDLYRELGDNIAMQYGGSEAHKKNLGSSGSGKQASCRDLTAVAGTNRRRRVNP